MEIQQISHKKRKIILIILVIVAIILSTLLTTYLYIHSYINKMNLITTSEDSTLTITKELPPESDSSQSQTEDIEPEIEDPNSPTQDSTENEIATIEADILENLEAKSTPISYDKDVFNVLLIGSDSRQAGGSGRSDSMIMISINKKTKTITVTSFLRDIYLQIPGYKNNRLNAAYAYGGADLLLETIEQNFKIQADRYASLDFYVFIDIVDALGGVMIEVTDEEIPVINDYVRELNRLTGQEEEKDCLTEAGTLLLNGKQALGYSRNRYVGNGDFERTARQRRVMEQIFEKVKTLDLLQMSNLFDIVLPQITTNLSEGEIFTLILSLPSYINYDIEQWSIPKSNSYSNLRIRGMSVLGIDFEESINELHSKIYSSNIE